MNNNNMQQIIKKAGTHAAAIVLFLVLVFTYFSPAVFEGKSILMGDDIRASGFGSSQMKEYEATAKPGEFSAWSDAMFGGMPYVAGYGDPAPSLPSFHVIDWLLKQPGYFHSAMVFVGLVCFYLLMCVMGINRWLAIAGAIAFAFASYNIVIIQAGHVVKAYVIGYMPLTIAGMVLLFRKFRLWGAVVFLLGVSLSLANGHIQITYYLMLLCFFIYFGYLIKMIKEKKMADLIKTTLIMAGCVLLAVMPSAKGMYSNWDLSEHSIRGPSELTPKPDATGKIEKPSTGLDKDYAFQWSYGWKELFTVLVPNAYGGASVGTLGNTSELYQAMRENGAQTGKEIQTYTYWGDKPITSGPVYFGALVCFLFILGMFVIRNPMKWWLFGASVFLTFLALGRNFDLFNDFLFHYLPFYNKFRTVEMALVIPNMVFPVVAVWGLHEMFTGKAGDAAVKKGLLWSSGIAGGLCLIIWLIPSFFFSFESTYDARIVSQFPDWYYQALVKDRASLASADALRSLLFILGGAALLLWFRKAKNKQQTAILVSAGMAILILADLWGIDKRYLNESHYVNERSNETYKESIADQEIFKDTDPSFRVLGVNDPWQNTDVSYFHHSLGGYHAVKLRRYQELIEHRLDKELGAITSSLSSAETTGDVQRMFLNTPSLNMLNTRYLIYNPGAAPVRNPFAYGNAWFVSKVDIVENADAEIEALEALDPLETAVVDKRFAHELDGFTPAPDSAATIVLEDYRPNHLTYSTKTATEQLAVFSEIYYQPGWKTKIDGTPATHFRADWTLRAMRIPAGEHIITFEFLPEGFVIAANVSAYSSFLILLLLIGIAVWSGWNAWKKYKKEA